MTTEDEDRPDSLYESVRASRERESRYRKYGERSIGQNLALIGSLGWLVIAPTLLGLFAGRWLDARLGTGIFWTGALLVAGVGVGCWLAWNRMAQER